MSEACEAATVAVWDSSEFARAVGTAANATALATAAAPEQAERLWSAAHVRLESVLASSTGATTADSKFLSTLASLAEAFVQIRGRGEASALLSCLQRLHDQIPKWLPQPPSSGRESVALASSVAAACEAQWRCSPAPRESLLPNLWLQRLHAVTLPDAKGSDVKRLCGLRGELSTLSTILEDRRSEVLERRDQLRTAVLRAAGSPLLGRSAEGERVLAQLWSLGESWVMPLHEAMRAPLGVARSPQAALYGRVYYRGWRGATGSTLLRMETALSELVEASLRAKSASLSSVLRHFMESFVAEKRQPGVDELLYRLYGPIIFRMLRAASADVRRQAITHLALVFPLREGESADAEAREELLRQQLDALDGTLNDDDAEVRTAAVRAVSRVLGVYWDILPPTLSRLWLQRLAGDLALDRASSGVRLAVVEGLRYVLLQSPHAHATLAEILPRLRDHIHDRCERVALALVELLEEVRNIRELRFFDVVPLNELLNRLAVADGPLQMRLMGLLAQSYFPPDKDAKEQVARAVVMLQDMPAAAIAFYKLLPAHASLDSLLKFLRRLVQYLGKKLSSDRSDTNSAMGQGTEAAVSSSSSTKKRLRGESSSESNSEALAPVTVSAALTVVAELYGAIQKAAAEKDREIQRGLNAVVDAPLLLRLWKAAEGADAAVQFLRWVARLPSVVVGEILPRWEAKLLQLRPSVSSSASAAESTDLSIPKKTDDGGMDAALLECLFASGRADAVLDILSGWLAAPLVDPEAAQQRMRRARRQDGGEEAKEAQQERAAEIRRFERAARLLETTLADERIRPSLLGHKKALETLMLTYRYLFSVLRKRIDGKLDGISVRKRRDLSDHMLVRAYQGHMNALVHLSSVAAREFHSAASTAEENSSSSSSIHPSWWLKSVQDMQSEWYGWVVGRLIPGLMDGVAVRDAVFKQVLLESVAMAVEMVALELVADSKSLEEALAGVLAEEPSLHSWAARLLFQRLHSSATKSPCSERWIETCASVVDAKHTAEILGMLRRRLGHNEMDKAAEILIKAALLPGPMTGGVSSSLEMEPVAAARLAAWMAYSPALGALLALVQKWSSSAETGSLSNYAQWLATQMVREASTSDAASVRKHHDRIQNILLVN